MTEWIKGVMELGRLGYPGIAFFHVDPHDQSFPGRGGTVHRLIFLPPDPPRAEVLARAKVYSEIVSQAQSLTSTKQVIVVMRSKFDYYAISDQDYGLDCVAVVNQCGVYTVEDDQLILDSQRE